MLYAKYFMFTMEIKNGITKSSQKLENETGRYNNIARENRKCTLSEAVTSLNQNMTFYVYERVIVI